MALCAVLIALSISLNQIKIIPMPYGGSLTLFSMLAATLTSLIQTIIGKFGMISAGTALWGDWFQLCFAAAMVVLAVILAIEGLQTFSKQAKGEKTGA